MIPPDVSKSPFKELRLVVPIRLVSDPFSHSLGGHDHALGALGYDAEPSEYSSPSSEEDQTSQHLVNYRDL